MHLLQFDKRLRWNLKNQPKELYINIKMQLYKHFCHLVDRFCFVSLRLEFFPAFFFAENSFGAVHKLCRLSRGGEVKNCRFYTVKRRLREGGSKIANFQTSLFMDGPLVGRPRCQKQRNKKNFKSPKTLFFMFFDSQTSLDTCSN